MTHLNGMTGSHADLAMLDAMGIQLWVERSTLINETLPTDRVIESLSALPTPVEPQGVDQVHKGQPESTLPVKVQHIRVNDSPITEVPPGKISANQESMVSREEILNDSEVSSVIGNKIEKPPVFQLQFWGFKPGIWFVTDEQNLTPQHHKLVHNLALYLVGRKRRPQHVGVFSWPMIDAPNIDQAPAVARKYLSQHLQQIGQICPINKIISFSTHHTWIPDAQAALPPLGDAFTQSEIKELMWSALQKIKSEVESEN